MFKRLAHVCLYSRDLDRTLSYYAKCGFTEVFRFTRDGIVFGAYLKIAEHQYLEVFEDRSLGPVINNGLAHFCLETEDIEDVIRRLTSTGIPFTPKKLGCDNTWQIWLTDPDGNSFEVHQYTGHSAQLTGKGPVEADW